jgi:hypothetical protein
MDVGSGSISLELAPWIRSGLRLVHFAGIILGIGAATLLDLIIFRFVLTRRIEDAQVRVIVFSSHIITAGLVLLWISGVGFFVYYWFNDPGKIDNPKLVAKVIIVGVLTLNALLVHSFVLPQVETSIGQRLLDGVSAARSFCLIFIGTLSAISWYVPLILGIVPQFNNTLPAEIILAGYATLIISVNLISLLALVIIHDK